MVKKYILSGLDCANCAEKIRAAAEKSELVSSAAMNFIRKELTVKCDVDIAEDELKTVITDIVKKTEPDVAVIDKEQYKEENSSHKADIIKIIISGVIFAAAIIAEHTLDTSVLPVYISIVAAYCVCYVINAAEVFVSLIKGLLAKDFFNEDTLMFVASMGAIILGEYEEAAAVMLFFAVGELLEGIAVNKSRRSISALIKTKPETASVLSDSGEYVTVAPESVEIGSVIRVKAGEKIPLDGVVLDGATSIDTSALTGESLPRDIDVGDSVPAGAINLSGVITVRTEKLFCDSTVYKMLEMVEQAAEKKTKTENFITVFAKYYTPLVVLAAVIVALIPPLFTGFAFDEWIKRGLIFLVISCPCALVISVPLGYFAGIGRASADGILIKGSSYLELISKAKAVLLDKTGTITKGEFEVTAIYPSRVSEEELLYLAAVCESGSNHPIARSVLKAYAKAIPANAAESTEEISGKGIRAVINGRTIICGSAKLLAENGITCESAAGTALYVACDGSYAGRIEISDTPKESSARAVKFLKDKGINVIMLTGDNVSAAEAIAKKTGIDEYYGELLPQDKSRITAEMQAKYGRVIFVGDGINDAPVITLADVGAAMGAKGSDSAIETADMVLMKDDLSQLCAAYALSRRTNRIVIENIAFALGVKLIVQVLGVLGLANMWAAVFADVGVTVIAVFNSLRLLRAKRTELR